jgi:hypothetical protein
MAINSKKGKARKGMIREREQFYDPRLGKWVKRHAVTKEILGLKASGPFASVRKIRLA